jgi:hypothetical protein
MPAPKTKSAPNSSGGSAKGKAPSTTTNGTTTPIPQTEKPEMLEQTPVLVVTGKPDKNVYDAEQDKIKTEIDSLQVKLVKRSVLCFDTCVHTSHQSSLRDKISLATKSGPGNDRRNTLRAELDSIREQQSNIKASRGKIIDQVKAIQDGIQKKV